MTTKHSLGVGFGLIILLTAITLAVYFPLTKKSQAPQYNQEAVSMPQEQEIPKSTNSDKRFRLVKFCDKEYKVSGDILVINNVDVLERIAEIATANPEDYVCNNIAINTPEGILNIEVMKQPLDDANYQKDTYFLSIKSTFRITGNTIYQIRGYGDGEDFYGNLK